LIKYSASLNKWIEKLSSINALIIISLLIISGDFFLLGKFSYIYTGDNATTHIPELLTLKFQGTINPLWNNFSGGGWDSTAVSPQGFINRYLFFFASRLASLPNQRCRPNSGCIRRNLLVGTQGS